MDLLLKSLTSERETNFLSALWYSHLSFFFLLSLPSHSCPSSEIQVLLKKMGPPNYNLSNWDSWVVTHPFCFLPPLLEWSPQMPLKVQYLAVWYSEEGEWLGKFLHLPCLKTSLCRALMAYWIPLYKFHISHGYLPSFVCSQLPFPTPQWAEGRQAHLTAGCLGKCAEAVSSGYEYPISCKSRGEKKECLMPQ